MQDHTQAGEHKKKLKLKIKLLPNGEYQKIEVNPSDTMHEVMIQAATALGVEILPPAPSDPLDQFFGVDNQGELHGPIENLSQSIADYLEVNDSKKDFALGLVLAFKVNAAWRVASKELMSPREILALFDMDFSQFTLYGHDSETPLPLDQEIPITRGKCFEAIKDGRYGSTC